MAKFTPGNPSIILATGRLGTHRDPGSYLFRTNDLFWFHLNQKMLKRLSSGSRTVFRAGQDSTSRFYECYGKEEELICSSNFAICGARKDRVRLDDVTQRVSGFKDIAENFQGIKTAPLLRIINFIQYREKASIIFTIAHLKKEMCAT